MTGQITGTATEAAAGDASDEVCLARREEHVLVVTLNRPGQRNALNAQLRAALRRAFDDYEADPSLRCAVLTGTGSAFCAGGDLKEMAGESVGVPPAEWGQLLGSRGTVDKPVIAAVNGFAIAGGFRLVQQCDLAVAGDAAWFGISEVKIGRGAPWAVPLLDIVGKRIMLELLLTGAPMSAARAYEVGLVNAVVPTAEVLDRALVMAHVIAANAPLSVAAAKAMVTAATESGQSSALAAADRIYDSVYRSQDALEGPRAFAERRAPAWTGT